MPIYEYQCKNCNHTFEEFFLTSKEVKAPACPKCKKGEVEKLLSKPGIQFKGKGFHKTDYRSNEYKQAVKCASCPKEGKCPKKKK